MAKRLSDRKLKSSVRSILEQELSHPKAVVVDVEDGVVTLGGSVLASELADLLAAVEAVTGMQGILNHMEVHESAENVPELQKAGLLKGRDLAPAAHLLAGAAGGALVLAGISAGLGAGLKKKRGKVGIALGSAGLGLLATSGISTLRRRRKGKDPLADLPQPLRDDEQVPALGTEEGTFQPETI